MHINYGKWAFARIRIYQNYLVINCGGQHETGLENISNILGIYIKEFDFSKTCKHVEAQSNGGSINIEFLDENAKNFGYYFEGSCKGQVGSFQVLSLKAILLFVLICKEIFDCLNIDNSW